MATTEQPTAASGGSTPLDLRHPGHVRWDELAVPPGWEPIAALAREIVERMDTLVPHVASRVEAEVHGYTQGVVPRADLEASARSNMVAMLIGLAERRDPTEEELGILRRLGARRAEQRLPIDAVVAGFHVGFRELWHALIEHVPADEPKTASQLLTAATTVWRWVLDVTDAIASTYAVTVRALDARVVGARQRFVELLISGDLDSAEAATLGATLGFDPVDDFRATVIRGATDELHAIELQRELELLTGRYAVAARGLLVVVISQGAAADEVVTTCRRLEPDAALATGRDRRGLRGARASLADAEQTLRVTAERDHATFDDAWLWATLAEANERLADLLASGVEAAIDHPHLAATVQAFADGGFSVTEAARRLQLHANSVSYRLERWQELTGWDPRRFDGLVRSLAAIEATD